MIDDTDSSHSGRSSNAVLGLFQSSECLFQTGSGRVIEATIDEFLTMNPGGILTGGCSENTS